MTTFSDWQEAQALRLGNDEDLDVVMVRMPDGSTVLEPIPPRAVTRATAEQREAIADLQEVTVEVRRLLAMLPELVETARDLRLSWQTIGWCVGTSGDAALKRWGDADRGRDGS